VPPGMRLTMLALDTRQAVPPAPPQPPPGPPAAPPGPPCSGPLLQATGALGAGVRQRICAIKERPAHGAAPASAECW